MLTQYLEVKNIYVQLHLVQMAFFFFGNSANFVKTEIAP